MGVPVIAVKSDSKSGKLINAICSLYTAAMRTREAAEGCDFTSRIMPVADELAWMLADLMTHDNVTGEAVDYCVGRIGVRIRVHQHVYQLRHVERKIEWAVLTYGDK